MQNELRLPNLSQRRQRGYYYTRKSLSHPAKMYTPIADWAIEAFSKPGDWVLDPMCGVGTTVVESMIRGRNAMGIELEEEWFKEAEKNCRRANAARPDTEYRLVLGDAMYTSVMVPDKKFDLIAFSPPYSDVLSAKKKHEGAHARVLLRLIKEKEGTWPVPKEVLRRYAKEWWERRPEGLYSYNDTNIGNMDEDGYKNAMEEIYKDLLAISAPSTKMVVVTRNPVKNWAQYPLDTLTIDLCQRAGWNYVDRYYAPIYRYSFWMMEYKKKCEEKGLGDIVPKHDDCLLFEVK